MLFSWSRWRSEQAKRAAESEQLDQLLGSLAEAVKAVAAFTRVSGVPDYREEWHGQSIYEVFLISLKARAPASTNAQLEGVAAASTINTPLYVRRRRWAVFPRPGRGNLRTTPPLVEIMQPHRELYFLRNCGRHDILLYDLIGQCVASLDTLLYVKKSGRGRGRFHHDTSRMKRSFAEK